MSHDRGCFHCGREPDCVKADLVKRKKKGRPAWAGIFKVTEEAGELIQVLMKLSVYPKNDHPGGEDLEARLVEEMGDLEATLEYFRSNLSDQQKFDVECRKLKKLKKFREWGLNGV